MGIVVHLQSLAGPGVHNLDRLNDTVRHSCLRKSKVLQLFRVGGEGCAGADWEAREGKGTKAGYTEGHTHTHAHTHTQTNEYILPFLSFRGWALEVALSFHAITVLHIRMSIEGFV